MEYVMWLFTYYLMNSSKESIWYSAWYIVDTTITSVLQTRELRPRSTILPKVTVS